MAEDAKYEQELREAAARYGVEVADLRAIRAKESGGEKDPSKAVSPAGAQGPMQLMPATAKDLGVDPSDPTQNINGGADYYARLLKKYDGDKRLALTAYNWGPGNTDKWLAGDAEKGIKPSDPARLPAETLDYIDTIAPLEAKKEGPSGYRFNMPGGKSVIINAPSFEAAQKGLKKMIAGQRHQEDIQTFAQAVDFSPIAPSQKELSQKHMIDEQRKVTPAGAQQGIYDSVSPRLAAKAAGVDIDSGISAGVRVKVGLLGDSPEASRAALEYYVTDQITKSGHKLPDGVPAVFKDENTGELAYWRPTEDGRLRPTLVNAPGIDAGDFAEFAPTAISAVVEGGAAAGGAVLGAGAGPVGAIAGAAAAGGSAAAATTFARREAAKMLGVPAELADKIDSDEALKNALIVGGSEVAFPVAAGAIRGVRNMGRFISAGDTQRLEMLKAALEKVKVSKEAIKASTGQDIVPTFGGATMDPEVAIQQANLRSRSVGKRAQRLGEEEIMRKQASANAVQKLTDNVVDVGPRLGSPIPAEDLGSVVQTTIKQPSVAARQSVARTADEAAAADDAVTMNARRVQDERATMEQNLARQDVNAHNPVHANLQDDVAAAQTRALDAEKETRQIFANHIEFNPKTHSSNVLLDNPADSPINKVINDLDVQGQQALSDSLARSKQSLVKDLGFKPEEAEGEVALKRLTDEKLDVYQLDVVRSHLLNSKDPGAARVVAAIDEQIGNGSYRRASTNRPIPKKADDIKDSLAQAQAATQFRKDTFETDAVRTILKQDANGAFEHSAGQVATYVLNPATPQVLKRTLEIVGNNPEKRAALLEELDRMHRAAVYPGGKYSEAANARFLEKYREQLGLLNDFQPTPQMAGTRAMEQAAEQQARGHVADYVRRAEDLHILAREARRRADRVQHALNDVYGRKIGADAMYSGNLAKDMMSDRLTSDQAAKIVSRLDQLHPALANEVKEKIGQWITNKLVTRAGNDTNATALEKLLKESGPKLEKIYGKEYVENLRHMSVLLGGEEFMKMVKPSAKETIPFLINLTRTLFGPLSKIQREFTAVGRAKMRTQEAMLDKMLSDPSRLDAYMKLATPDLQGRALQALKARAGIEGVMLPQETGQQQRQDQQTTPLVRQLREINSRPRQ